MALAEGSPKRRCWASNGECEQKQSIQEMRPTKLAMMAERSSAVWRAAKKPPWAWQKSAHAPHASPVDAAAPVKQKPCIFTCTGSARHASSPVSGPVLISRRHHAQGRNPVRGSRRVVSVVVGWLVVVDVVNGGVVVDEQTPNVSFYPVPNVKLVWIVQ